MLAIRLIAVYAVAALTCTFMVRRWLVPLQRSTIAFLVLAPCLITGRALVTAGVYAPLDIAYQADPLASLRAEKGIGVSKTPILGDVVSQEIPWRKAVREAIKNGRAPLWNRFILAGEPLLAAQQPAVLHPSTWIGMLLPLAQAWTFEMTFTLFIALISGYLFFRGLDLGEVPAYVGACGWAFCDYIGFFLGYPLAPAVAPFPLLLLGLTWIARKRSTRGVTLTTLALVLIVVAGHSETLLHAVAAGGLYFLFYLAPESRKDRLKAIGLSVIAGALTLGLTAVILAPHIEALPHTVEYFLRKNWYAKVPRSTSFGAALSKLQQFVVPFSFGVSGRGSFAPNQGPSVADVGSLLLPLAVVGATSRRRIKWMLFLLLFLGLAMWTTLPIVNDVICRLPLFDIAINERLVFLAAFSTVSLAALGTEQIATGRARRLLLWCLACYAGGLGIFVLAISSRLRALGMPASFQAEQAALLIAPPFLAWIWWTGRRTKPPVRALAGVLVLFLGQRAAQSAFLYPVAPNRAFYPPLPVLDAIPRHEPFRMSAVGFTFIPNISALYELEDVRGYEAMTFRPLFETYPLWCVAQPVWFNRIDDPTRPFLSFLNVRYFLLPEEHPTPTGWLDLSRGNGLRVVLNPHALPRVFVPRTVRTELDPAKRIALMSRIHDFSEEGVLGTPNQVAAATPILNGGATVTTDRYSPQSIRLHVEATRDVLLGTSITAWPGWQLRIDGRRSPLVAFNHAFLGFVVPTGRHTADLRYLPTGYLVGVTLSVLTGLLIATLCLLLRARAHARST